MPARRRRGATLIRYSSFTSGQPAMWPCRVSTQAILLLGAENVCIVSAGTCQAVLPARMSRVLDVSISTARWNTSLSVRVSVPCR